MHDRHMILVPVFAPLNPVEAYEHTPAQYYRTGEYPRFIRPPGPRLGDHKTETHFTLSTPNSTVTATQPSGASSRNTARNTMKTREETATLAALLGLRSLSSNPIRIAADTLKLCRLASAANSNAVALCNGWRDQDAFDKKAASIERQANDIAGHYWLRAKAGGDPRGYVLHLFSTNAKKPLAGNTWGGDESGFGI